MTFTGTFYFAGAIDGVVTGAVFCGQGTMRAAAPPSDFERENVKRLLGADAVESDFKTAVLRFSDDTFSLISANRKDGAAPVAIQKLGNDTDCPHAAGGRRQYSRPAGRGVVERRSSGCVRRAVRRRAPRPVQLRLRPAGPHSGRARSI